MKDNMETPKKRNIPGLLRTVLAVDAYLSNTLVNTLERFLPLEQYKSKYKVLEISCHGIPWLTFPLLSIWVFGNKNLYQMQINLLIGSLLDIAIVAMLKAITRRRRPAINDDTFTMGPDKYSFPSGHASRAAFVAYFFLYLWPLPTIYALILLAWVFSVCISRLLMRRHHILDIFVGIVVGIFEGLIIGYIYLENNTCINVVSWLTDEKIHGPEYDV